MEYLRYIDNDLIPIPITIVIFFIFRSPFSIDASLLHVPALIALVSSDLPSVYTSTSNYEQFITNTRLYQFHVTPIYRGRARCW